MAALAIVAFVGQAGLGSAPVTARQLVEPWPIGIGGDLARTGIARQTSGRRPTTWH